MVVVVLGPPAGKAIDDEHDHDDVLRRLPSTTNWQIKESHSKSLG